MLGGGGSGCDGLRGPCPKLRSSPIVHAANDQYGQICHFSRAGVRHSELNGGVATEEASCWNSGSEIHMLFHHRRGWEIRRRLRDSTRERRAAFVTQ